VRTKNGKGELVAKEFLEKFAAEGKVAVLN
jgi:hypothetical protein